MTKPIERTTSLKMPIDGSNILPIPKRRAMSRIYHPGNQGDLSHLLVTEADGLLPSHKSLSWTARDRTKGLEVNMDPKASSSQRDIVGTRGLCPDKHDQGMTEIEKQEILKSV